MAPSMYQCHHLFFQLFMYLVVKEVGLPDTGDFWHARGALPVVALNSVLEEFRGWTQPTLMLVGNHDQARCPCHRSLATACLSGTQMHH